MNTTVKSTKNISTRRIYFESVLFMSVRIVDTHVHVWNFERAAYPWLYGDTSILNRTYHIEELEKEREAAGVTAGVLVQAANNPEDTEWMLEVAARHPWIKGVVGWLPLEDPSETEKNLTHFLKNPYFKGVRHLIHNEPNERWLLQKNVVESLSILENHQIPYDLVGVKEVHIRTALELASQVPDLKMVFDHLNQPPISTKQRFGNWGALMKQAAAHPNFYVKISGLGTASGNWNSWTPDELKPYIDFVLEHFGEDRCFCGGDWPVSLLAGSYERTWQAYRSIIDSLLDPEQRDKVYYRNAEKFYGLE